MLIIPMFNLLGNLEIRLNKTLSLKTLFCNDLYFVSHRCLGLGLQSWLLLLFLSHILRAI